jgi:cyclophilin family peptidyl-prolyl cis-trans isomerase
LLLQFDVLSKPIQIYHLPWLIYQWLSVVEVCNNVAYSHRPLNVVGSLGPTCGRFHQITTGFMIQGSDLRDTMELVVVQFFVYHTNPSTVVSQKKKLRYIEHVGPGVVSTANSGPNTNGIQFFITTNRTSYINGRHAVFGTVEDGWDLVILIQSYGTDPCGKLLLLLLVSHI